MPLDPHTGVAAAYKVPFPLMEHRSIESQDESWHHFMLSLCCCCRIMRGLNRPFPANLEEVADECAIWRTMKDLHSLPTAVACLSQASNMRNWILGLPTNKEREENDSVGHSSHWRCLDEIMSVRAHILGDSGLNRQLVHCSEAVSAARDARTMSGWTNTNFHIYGGAQCEQWIEILDMIWENYQHFIQKDDETGE